MKLQEKLKALEAERRAQQLQFEQANKELKDKLQKVEEESKNQQLKLEEERKATAQLH